MMATLIEHCARLLVDLGLNDVEPVHLASAFGNVPPRRLAPGEVLCVEGEPADSLFLLLLGGVRVQRADAQGQPREVAVLAAPRLVGHLALIDGSARSATCLAEGDVGLIALERSTYERLLTEASPRAAALRRVLMTSLAAQLASANARVQALAAAPPTVEATERDVDELSDLLQGLKVDRALERAAEAVEVVYTDEQRRNWRGLGAPPR